MGYINQETYQHRCHVSLVSLLSIRQHSGGQVISTNKPNNTNVTCSGHHCLPTAHWACTFGHHEERPINQTTLMSRVLVTIVFLQPTGAAPLDIMKSDQ
ncbi:hypothetical protein RRG08_057646 [Elysia crispata]|uniref:Uncharacterized protein n=1 Tax=Elysia crispata TaxID=231223 RepID=A0AAE1A2F6_9GAST|nr:hypothetical protein RRG08_057646 [Elysia crispata]